MKTASKDKENIPNGLYPLFLASKTNKKLEEYVYGYKNIPVQLFEPIRYCLLSGGKRFRPVLSLATAISLGKKPEYVLPTACAIEFIHTYSLIHDDLPAIDNDDMRRGKPSCHKKFGEDIAILAGDALFAEAFNIILKYQEGTAEQRLDVLSEIAGASGASGMVAGQVEDIKASKSIISKKKLEDMHLNKTARLISASVSSAAILSDCTKSVLESYREYGLNIGLAFQITDDIIDITSNSSLTGKTQGKDQVQFKNTYPLIWGMERSKVIAAERIEIAIEAIEKVKTDSELLKDIAKFILVRKG